jgi:dipeptidase
MLTYCSLIFLFLSKCVLSLLQETDRCTSILVGPKAGTEGPMTTHNSDCADCDFRVNKVPAMDWPRGSMRPLYLYRGSYPSTVSQHRGNTWKPENLQGTPEQLKSWGTSSQITGYIPQVEHTFALFEGQYGIMNEHQVAIGESTCASKFWAPPTIAGGKAMIEVREMSKIALERTTSAREAILLMGELATKYGFYSCDWSGGDDSKGEGGEALTVIDTKEAWMFHVTSDDTGASAVWVAQRIPDDHVSVVANLFVIRKIDPNSPDFLYSKNLWEVAERNNLWSPADGLLDFTPTFSPQREHPIYGTRRVWRVLSQLAPSLNLDPNTDAFGSSYPFSVKPDNGPVSKEIIMKLMRDHYEGSQFDLTKGLASGPYGEPNRWDWNPTGNMSLFNVSRGSFERAISLFRTSYSIVAQARPHLPAQIGALVWYTQYAPSVSSYIPLYVASESPPAAFTRGSLFQYDSQSSWWSFSIVGNWAARFYSYAMTDVIEVQQELEKSHFSSVRQLDISASKLLDKYHASKEGTKYVTKLLTDFTLLKGSETVLAYRDLWHKLVTKYHDGYVAKDIDSPTINMYSMFYPKWWLEAVGFFSGPIVFKPLPPLEPSDTPAGPPSDPSSNLPTNPPSSPTVVSHSTSKSSGDLFMVILITGFAGLAFGYYATKRLDGEDASGNSYSVVSNNL